MDNKSAKKRSFYDCFQDEINNEQFALQCNISNNGKSVRKIRKLNEKNSTVNINNLQHTNYSNKYNNCNDMLNVFNDAFETIYGDNNINSFQVHQISEELQINCIRLVNMIKTQNDSMEMESLKSKYTLLENESLTTINQLQCQITELNLQLEQQSSFNSIIGSTFGFYLWEATQEPSVVDIILQNNKLTNMAELMTSILNRFIKTYNNNNMPSIKSHETKVVLSILGIVANLTIKKTGRYFFSQIDDGINVINLIISLVLNIPSSLENDFKKIAYAALYNVSIQFDGHLLMENNKLIKTLHNDIKTISNKDVNDKLIFALKLLHSLTTNISKSMYIIFKKETNLQEILKLTRYTETELTARKIYENINVGSEKYALQKL